MSKLLWMRIAKIEGIGPISFHSLRRKYADPAEALKYLEGLGKRLPDPSYIEDEIRRANDFGARIVLFQDPEYPKLLREIHDAPPFIYVKGDLDPDKLCISIVGSRNSSISSNKFILNLAERLVECGYCVVSGMARGVDRQAHLGGIKNTIAVLGCGLDQIYPPENRDVYQRIMNCGAIISEAPMGTQPAPHLFPARNRLIAGLSVATVVAQATRYSGSLITAQYATDYGRDLFAVPGCPLDPRSYGPNNLIKNGAGLVQDHNDILQNLSCYPRQTIEPDQVPESHQMEETTASFKSTLLDYLSTTPVNIDDLQAKLDRPIASIRQVLVELELEDKVYHVPGNRVARLY